MAKPRKFSPEFKAKIALAALRGETITSELRRKHQLSDTVISRWKLQLVKSAHQIFAAATPDDAQRQRTDDLERLIGQLTVELDAAKNAVEGRNPGTTGFRLATGLSPWVGNLRSRHSPLPLLIEAGLHETKTAQALTPEVPDGVHISPPDP